MTDQDFECCDLAQVASERDTRLSDALRMMTEKFDQADQKRAYWKTKAEAHGSCSCNTGPGVDGPDECCPEHGRTYGDWIERGNVLQARINAVREIIAKVRRTPAANDPYRVALDIADDLEAAVYLDAPNPSTIEELRAALTTSKPPVGECPSSWCGPWRDGLCVDCGNPRKLGDPPSVPLASPECCASGRCEVCSPGFDWGRNG